MCGWSADVGSSGDDREMWRSGSKGREGQYGGYRSLWLCEYTQFTSTLYCIISSSNQFYPRSLLTGGLGLFFLLVVDLEPENRLFKAASAALALATFLLGPVPRKTCLSTSTCPQHINILRLLSYLDITSSFLFSVVFFLLIKFFSYFLIAQPNQSCFLCLI